MFRIAVCDDSKYDLQEISATLEQLKEEGLAYELCCYSDGFSLIRDFEMGKRYHLLILDMVMEPINGIETAKAIRQNDLSMPILIVTSTMEYALDGYQVNAWRYLTKPIDRGRFLQEVREIFRMAQEREQTYFVIESDKGIVKLRLDDILYFDSNLHTITVHTLKLSYPFRGTIGSLSEKYKNAGFFRIHKSYLVNLRYVQKISRQQVVLVNGETLDLSKLRSAALHQALLDYVSRESQIFRN